MSRTASVIVASLIATGCSTQQEPVAWSHRSANEALSTGIAADAILGQLNERANAAMRTDAGSLGSVDGVAVGGGHLWVADRTNRRVLGWRDVTNLTAGGQNGTEADVVLLQPNAFVSDHRNIPTTPINHAIAPTGVAVDDADRLYVDDGINVIVFNDPYSDDRVADYELTGEPAGIVAVRPLNNNKLAVVGASSVVFYEQGSPDPYGQSTLTAPCAGSVTDIAEAGSAYLVACSTGITCSIGFGTCSGIYAYEIDGATDLPEQPLVPFLAYNDFVDIRSLQMMNDFLLIAEAGRHRIAHFSGTASHAAGVITAAGAPRLNTNTTTFYGQPDAISAAPNAGSANVNADGFNYPNTLAVDQADQRMWVADFNNTRLLGFNNVGVPAPTETAQIVLGQPDMSHILPNRLEAASFRSVRGVAIGPGSGGAVRGVVVDNVGHRVLVYDAIDGLTTGAAPTHVIGQPSGEDYDVNAFSTVPNVGARDLAAPTHSYVDEAGTVWVNDAGNNRILVYGALGSSQAATAAYGSTSTNAAGTAFPNMTGLAVSATHLFVAAGNRVLVYELANAGEAPARVFGQEQPDALTPTVVGDVCNRGGTRPDSLCNVTDVAVDSAGTLWVADSGNSRVLWFDNPMATDITAATTADGVVGQPDFVSAGAFGGLARGPWGFSVVQGIALDDNGTLWVVDSGDSRVLAFFDTSTRDATTGMPHAGVVLGQATSAAAGGNNDPNGVNARTLNGPLSIAVSADGRVVLVADSANNRALRYIDNQAPSLDGAGLYPVPRGGSLTVAISASDPENDAVTVTPVDPVPPGATADSSAVTYAAAADTPVGTRARVNFVLEDNGPRPQYATASVIFEVTERAEPATSGTPPAPRAPREPGSGCTAAGASGLTALLAIGGLRRRRRRR